MPPNPHTLKPFKKGDPRINRDGRPKNSGELGALFRRIGHEPATKKNGEPVIGPDGRPMTVLEVIARQWAQDAKKQEAFVERGFGKVPQAHEPQEIINWTPDEWRKEAARRQSETDDTLASFSDE